MGSVCSQGSGFPFPEPLWEPPTISLPPWPAERRKETGEVFWTLVPPSVCFLIWGGAGASDPDAAFEPGVLQEILLTHYLLSSAPWPVARKSQGQETNIWSQGCSVLHFLLLVEWDTGE